LSRPIYDNGWDLTKYFKDVSIGKQLPIAVIIERILEHEQSIC
jgi:hypothetical protein